MKATEKKNYQVKIVSISSAHKVFIGLIKTTTEKKNYGEVKLFSDHCECRWWRKKYEMKKFNRICDIFCVCIGKKRESTMRMEKFSMRKILYCY